MEEDVCTIFGEESCTCTDNYSQEIQGAPEETLQSQQGLSSFVWLLSGTHVLHAPQRGVLAWIVSFFGQCIQPNFKSDLTNFGFSPLVVLLILVACATERAIGAR